MPVVIEVILFVIALVGFIVALFGFKRNIYFKGALFLFIFSMLSALSNIFAHLFANPLINFLLRNRVISNGMVGWTILTLPGHVFIAMGAVIFIGCLGVGLYKNK